MNIDSDCLVSDFAVLERGNGRTLHRGIRRFVKSFRSASADNGKELSVAGNRLFGDITPENTEFRRVQRTDLMFDRQTSFVVVGIHLCVETELFLIRGAGDRSGFFSCGVQGGQEQAGEDCDDRNYHKELYKGEVTGFVFFG